MNQEQIDEAQIEVLKAHPLFIDLRAAFEDLMELTGCEHEEKIDLLERLEEGEN